MRIIGLDPGLRHTGWSVIDKDGSHLRFVSAGVISPNTELSLSERLSELHTCLMRILQEFEPDEASVEETFVNKNPNSTLKLGQARGVVILAPALFGIPVSEYAPNQIKKMIVGVGRAQKGQVDMMVRTLLPTVPENIPPDSADATAIALCHSFLRKPVL